MKYEPYQQYATNFIENNPIAAVFLECGMGKTIITLTAIQHLLQRGEIHHVLVIAPLRVAKTVWRAEIEKWNLQLSCAIAVGTQAERLKALAENADITVINRENVAWLAGVGTPCDMLVIDELSSFKSHRTQRFKALRKMRPQFKRVVGLTGTPSSNGLMDLWAQFRILDNGARLGQYIGQYRDKYFLPDKRNGQIIYTYKPRADAEEKIYARIADITMSLKAVDHLHLPECIYNNIVVQLESDERDAYNTLKREMILQLGDTTEPVELSPLKGIQTECDKPLPTSSDNSPVVIDAKNAANLANKLRQMANGFVYADGQTYDIHAQKLDALCDLIEEMNGKPTLVAYWFKSDLARIEKRLKIATIDTPENIAKWNNGEIAVGLIHPASSGHGLNLQHGGSTLIWYSLPWSLELYQQTNARLYRQGQREPVCIHHLLTRGTIDEAIDEALTQKSATQERLIDAVKAELQAC